MADLKATPDYIAPDTTRPNSQQTDQATGLDMRKGFDRNNKGQKPQGTSL